MRDLAQHLAVPVVQSGLPTADRLSGNGTEAVTFAKEPRDHLSTDHLLSNLKGRTISSGIITAFSQALQFCLNLGAMMLLARLLTPRDFGLVAMVLTVMAVLRIFKDAGLSTATVQREGITHAQVSNLFWINLFVGGGTALIFASAAPAIAWFYHEPKLVTVALVLSLTFLFSGAAVQHIALLNRQMRFTTIAFIEVGSMVTGISVGILMAWLKFGYWSLVGVQLLTPCVACGLTWMVARWRPQWPSAGEQTRSLLSFGANITASSLLYSLARGMDGFFIGRLFGSGPMGLYSRAAALVIRPLEQALGPLNAVFVPVLSRLQTQPERYRRTFLHVYEAVGLGCLIGGSIMFALTRPLTLVVLGAKWEAAAPILSAFTVAILFYPFCTITSWLFASQGRGNDLLVASVVMSLVTVSAFAAGLIFGPAGVALGFSLSGVLVQLPIYFYLAGRRGPVSTKDLWIAFLRQLPICAVVGATTWLVHHAVLAYRPWVQLMICAPVGMAAAAIFVFLYGPSRRTALTVINAVLHWRTAK